VPGTCVYANMGESFNKYVHSMFIYVYT
jgi:hypothetical protein